MITLTKRDREILGRAIEMIDACGIGPKITKAQGRFESEVVDLLKRIRGDKFYGPLPSKEDRIICGCLRTVGDQRRGAEHRECRECGEVANEVYLSDIGVVMDADGRGAEVERT